LLDKLLILQLNLKSDILKRVKGKKVDKKVNQSRYRPGVAQRVPGN